MDGSNSIPHSLQVIEMNFGVADNQRGLGSHVMEIMRRLDSAIEFLH